MLEHLSFRLGNQLFFVRVTDADHSIDVPSSAQGLLRIATACRGFACEMPMKRSDTAWRPTVGGWGLVDARTGCEVDPPSEVSDELIEMTDWEVHDFAVQVVRDQLEKRGRQLLVWQGDPNVDPSLWFVGDEGSEWIVVRAVRYPKREAPRPANWDRIAEMCAKVSRKGHFATMNVSNGNQPTSDGVLALWRGHGLLTNYRGFK